MDGPDPDVMSPKWVTADYLGSATPLFWLGLRTSLLTLLTLGLYRFWARTRVRRYFWSSITLEGDPLEYTGKGLEKFLGFLIAVAFLAVYLGIFQLILSFLGLSVFSADETGEFGGALQLAWTQASLILIVPFIFYAQYRARRYVLSRTQWRGIRFGAEPAAWGYVWRALGHWIVTIISLGLLAPRMVFWLEKYRVDRTWFGNTRFEQGGTWTMLYPAMRHIFIAFALLAIGALLIFGLQSGFSVLFFMVGGVWVYFGLVYFRVESFRILAQHKSLGDIGFKSTVRPSEIFWTQILGGVLASAVAGLFFGVLFGMSVGILGTVTDLEGAAEQFFETGLETVQPQVWLGFAAMIVSYLLFLLLYGVFLMIFVIQPILERYVKATLIENAGALEDVEQRLRDDMVEAEGFADALDVGPAI